MSTDRLEQIRQRMLVTTRGPWQSRVVALGEPIRTGALVAATGPKLRIVSETATKTRPAEDAEFIAHAHEDIPYLLDTIETLTRQRDELVQALEDTQRAYTALEQERQRLKHLEHYEQLAEEQRRLIAVERHRANLSESHAAMVELTAAQERTAMQARIAQLQKP
jgi:vacuolar-type H+-ATPase subunit I/STV1